MRMLTRSVTLLALGLAWVTANAQIPEEIKYTDKATFLEALQPGYFYNNFATVPAGGPQASLDFTSANSLISYQISAPPSGLYGVPGADRAVGTYVAADALVINFTSGNVHMVGADTFLTDSSDNRIGGTITVTFSNGSSIEVPSATGTTPSFVGLYSATPITQMRFTGGLAFNNIDNLYASVDQVPEPATGALLLMGGVAFLALRRRQS